MVNHLITIISVFMLLLIGGAQVYHVVEGWNYVDSIYFVVITATTIGYGDLVPQSNMGKIITIFFSFAGIAISFFIISIIAKFIFQKESKKVKESIKKSVEKKDKDKKK